MNKTVTIDFAQAALADAYTPAAASAHPQSLLDLPAGEARESLLAVHSLLGASLPPTAQLRIDPTFSQPGVQLTINLTRNHLDRLDQAKAAVNEIFAAVPEL